MIFSSYYWPDWPPNYTHLFKLSYFRSRLRPRSILSSGISRPSHSTARCGLWWPWPPPPSWSSSWWSPSSASSQRPTSTKVRSSPLHPWHWFFEATLDSVWPRFLDCVPSLMFRIPCRHCLDIFEGTMLVMLTDAQLSLFFRHGSISVIIFICSKLGKVPPSNYSTELWKYWDWWNLFY